MLRCIEVHGNGQKKPKETGYVFSWGKYHVRLDWWSGCSCNQLPPWLLKFVEWFHLDTHKFFGTIVCAVVIAWQLQPATTHCNSISWHILSSETYTHSARQSFTVHTCLDQVPLKTRISAAHQWVRTCSNGVPTVQHIPVTIHPMQNQKSSRSCSSHLCQIDINAKPLSQVTIHPVEFASSTVLPAEELRRIENNRWTSTTRTPVSCKALQFAKMPWSVWQYEFHTIQASASSTWTGSQRVSSEH